MAIIHDLSMNDEEIHFHCMSRTPRHQKYYVTDEERRTLIEDLGDAAYILYARYLELVGTNKQDLDDNTLASDLGWNYHKVRRVRQQLMKADWFAKDSGDSRIQKRTHYYFGKAAMDFNTKVLAAKNKSEKFD